MPSPTPLSKANTCFSLDLSKKLGDNDKSTNIFYSPFSISSALAMVMLGTRGDSATQISEVLHFTEAQQLKQNEVQQQRQQMEKQSPMQSQMQTRMQMKTQIQQSSRLPQYLLKCLKPQASQDGVHAYFAQLLNELNKPDAAYSLSSANRLYGDKSYQFIEDFLERTRKNYNAELESVDFKTSTEEARININSWVEKQSQGKIKDVLAQGMVDSMTKLVLVNAIYFKGNWNKQFMEDSTVDAQFRINKNDSKLVKMMYQKNEFPFASIPEAACQVIEMPYKGNDLSMLIFLPNDIEDNTTGLEKLEKELTYEKFVEWTHPAKMHQVEVKLPRFKMETKYDLKEVLKSMGMVNVFDATKCDFSGMSTADDLVLSAVIHKAFVEVNEEGTEAAAATGAMANCALHQATFIADHPFLFFIRHNPSMGVLFAGRYCSPE